MTQLRRDTRRILPALYRFLQRLSVTFVLFSFAFRMLLDTSIVLQCHDMTCPSAIVKVPPAALAVAVAFEKEPQCCDRGVSRAGGCPYPLSSRSRSGRCTCLLTPPQLYGRGPTGQYNGTMVMAIA